MIKRVVAGAFVAAAAVLALSGASTASAATAIEYGAAPDATAIEYGLLCAAPSCPAVAPDASATE